MNTAQKSKKHFYTYSKLAQKLNWSSVMPKSTKYTLLSHYITQLCIFTHAKTPRPFGRGALANILGEWKKSGCEAVEYFSRFIETTLRDIEFDLFIDIE